MNDLTPPERITVLEEERRHLKSELERYQDRLYLNTEEQLRALSIKRRKLAVKDEIAALLRES